MARLHLSVHTPTADGPLQAKLDEHDTALDALDAGSGGVTDGGVVVATVDGYALLAGRAGGQTLNGGTGASEVLLLKSTAHATKGQIQLGSSTGFVYNAATGEASLGVAPQAGYLLYLKRATGDVIMGFESPLQTVGIEVALYSGARSANLRCNGYSVGAGTTQGETNADLTYLFTSGCDRLALMAAGDYSSILLITNSVRRLTVSATTFTFWDGGLFAFGTTTGTKIGTATTQKLGFWNVTPVVQQVLATGGTADNIITFLQTIGLCRQS